ncbi:uncharacterized protein METZ01_LOCUS113642 [marine metagenome]|uniref:Transmembrane protein n=1 Tax=marine metagenome TaxID=408172 RepID=A0A381X7Z4_9ZZZZ
MIFKNIYYVSQMNIIKPKYQILLLQKYLTSIYYKLSFFCYLLLLLILKNIYSFYSVVFSQNIGFF